MYLSGDQYDFEQRLHAMSENTGDLLTGFFPEGQYYSGNASPALDPAVLYKWDREYNLKWLSFSNQIITNTFYAS